MFDRISILGSASIHLLNVCVNDDMNVNITGSGDVILPTKQFNSLALTISGSGDIVGNKTHTNIINAVVTGSGDIRDITCLRHGIAIVTGSGDIKLYKKKDANISKKCTGSGNIKILSV